MRTPRSLALIPTLLPRGEGLENPSPCGRGEGVRAGLRLVPGHFVRRSKATIFIILLPLTAALPGCAGLYFHDAGAPPAPPPQYRLADWPYKEYWTGFVFNGAKIGFSRLRIAPAEHQAGRYQIRSEATFTLRFLGVEKKIQVRSLDLVRDDLALVEFAHDYSIDGNELKLTGAVEGGVLRVAADTRGNRTKQEFPVMDKVYPTSVIALYPVRHGLEIGRRYVYEVYDGQSQTLAPAEQEIQAYERSELFEGNAYRIRTRLLGHGVTTWINDRGIPLFELALNGAMISAHESEAEAKRYLTQASLNKQDVLLDFSLVRVDTPIPEPRRTARLRIALEGLDAGSLPPNDPGQQCRGENNAVLCEIRALAPAANRARPPRDGYEKYLRPTLTAPSVDPRIRAQARAIAGDEAPSAAVALLVDWMQKNIERVPVDVFSAIDVLEGKKAECQGHAYLYTALARALGIPTRVVNGLVYAEEHRGFLYHSWNESLVNGEWLPVDPTFGQVGADATHIKLIEGERPADLLPLVEMVGKIKARVVSFDAR